MRKTSEETFDDFEDERRLNWLGRRGRGSRLRLFLDHLLHERYITQHDEIQHNDPNLSPCANQFRTDISLAIIVTKSGSLAVPLEGFIVVASDTEAVSIDLT